MAMNLSGPMLTSTLFLPLLNSFYITRFAVTGGPEGWLLKSVLEAEVTKRRSGARQREPCPVVRSYLRCHPPSGRD